MPDMPLRRIREARGYSREQLIRAYPATGITLRMVQYAESGMAACLAEPIRQVLQALGADPDEAEREYQNWRLTADPVLQTTMARG